MSTDRAANRRRRNQRRSATYRRGGEEIRRATAILEQEVSAELKAHLIPVHSPGRASMVNTLYEMGVRGDKLDYQAFDEAWESLVGGSSSYAGEDFLIHADEESSRVFLTRAVPAIYGKWNELPGTPGWPTQKCVEINKPSLQVRYFEQDVKLEPRQLEVLVALVESFLKTGRPVPEQHILMRVALPEGANLAPVMSRIRSAFKASTSGMNDVLAGTAAELVTTLLPAKRRHSGFTIGRPELFYFSEILPATNPQSNLQ